MPHKIVKREKIIYTLVVPLMKVIYIYHLEDYPDDFYYLPTGNKFTLLPHEQREMRPLWLQIGDTFKYDNTFYEVIDIVISGEDTMLRVTNKNTLINKTFTLTTTFSLMARIA